MKYSKTGRRITMYWILMGASYMMFSCRPADPDIVNVETGAILEVGPSSCTVEGEILSLGESGVSSYGFVWSEEPDPILETGLNNDLGEAYSGGIYQYTIRKLSAETTYYLRAYASGGDRITYGAVKSFTTSEAGVPRLITFGVYNYTATGGFSGGNITDDGGRTINACGICWSTERFPDLDDIHTDEGGGLESFESYLNGLTAYTVYYVRAYATNEAGTGYGQEVAFRTYWDGSPVSDVDGNEYPTVQIGDRVWMAMNLRSMHYADGTPLDLVETDASWADMEADAGAYCYYGNQQEQKIYGALYNWSAATRDPAAAEIGEEVQGVCPDGWYLPTDEEWKTLEMDLGMTWLTADKDGWRGYEEGGMLKIEGTEYWNEPNEMATNESGFNAAPAGTRGEDGIFSGLGDHTVYWTATGVETASAWVRALHTLRGEIKREYVNRKAGYSVRCIMDE